MVNTGTVTIVDNSDQTRIVTFAGMVTASGTSPSFSIGPFQNATLTIQGTFASATIVMNGSNDGGTTWFAMKDWQNTAVSATSNALINLGPVPLLVQFSWSGGGSSTSLTAYLGFAKNYF